jgi:hypothetical protein
MRLSFIILTTIIVPQLTLMGCQMSPINSSSLSGAGGVSQSIISAPSSLSQASASINTISDSSNTASSSIGMVADAISSKSSDVISGSDAGPKAPFSLGGAFSGAMIAIGLKDSPAEIAAKEQLQAAKDFAASQIPRGLKMIIEASADANGDLEGHGYSTIFRFYSLQDVANFAKIGLEEAGDSHALPYQEELILPNRLTQIRVKYPSDSQFIAILFQLHNRAHRWRLLIPTNRLQTEKPLHIMVGRCDIRVTDGLKPLIVRPTLIQTTSSTTLKKLQVSVIESELSTVCKSG